MDPVVWITSLCLAGSLTMSLLVAMNALMKFYALTIKPPFLTSPYLDFSDVPSPFFVPHPLVSSVATNHLISQSTSKPLQNTLTTRT